MNKTIGFGVAALAVLLGIVVFGPLYNVAEGYRGVVTRFGALEAVTEPGLRWKTPFIESVTEMSVQSTKGSLEKLNVYSKDVQQFDAKITINAHLMPNMVGHVFSNYGKDYWNVLVFPRLYQQFKDASGQFTAAEIVSNRDKLASTVVAMLNEDFLKAGIVVDSLQIEDIKFTKEYEKAIEAAAQAEADVKRARQEYEKAKVEYGKQVAEADAQAKATRTRAEAEAYQTTVKGNAEASAIAARGKALRDNPQLVDLITAEKWNGVLPTTMVPGSAVPFMGVK